MISNSGWYCKELANNFVIRIEQCWGINGLHVLILTSVIVQVSLADFNI